MTRICANERAVIITERPMESNSVGRSVVMLNHCILILKQKKVRKHKINPFLQQLMTNFSLYMGYYIIVCFYHFLQQVAEQYNNNEKSV